MKAGKITAKLRDAIKVCFMVEGEEVKRYKNIEMPDALKELEIRDFGFNVLTDGKIEFWLHFDQGILPEEWPECRERKHRGAKADEQIAAAESDEPVTEPDAAEVAPEVIDATSKPEIAPEAIEVTSEPGVVQEATEATIVPDVAPEASDTAIVPERAKRGRKPGKRAKIEPQPEEAAM